MTVVAVSASYGAAGSRIGPAVAERLGVPFLDRAIPLAVAEQLNVTLDDAAAHDGQATAGWLDRILRGFVGSDTGSPSPLPPEVHTSEDFQRATERLLLEQAATGEGVILGRGGAAVLRKDPRVLRVRLSGPVKRRIEQAVRLGVADRKTAERTLRDADRTQAEYVRRFYDFDINDPKLYHLVLDSTAFEVDACVELIVQAARSLGGGIPTLDH